MTQNTKKHTIGQILTTRTQQSKGGRLVLTNLKVKQTESKLKLGLHEFGELMGDWLARVPSPHMTHLHTNRFPVVLSINHKPQRPRLIRSA